MCSVIGSETLVLKKSSMKSRTKLHNLELNYKYDDPKDPVRLYTESDHYILQKNWSACCFI